MSHGSSMVITLFLALPGRRRDQSPCVTACLGLGRQSDIGRGASSLAGGCRALEQACSGGVRAGAFAVPSKGCPGEFPSARQGCFLPGSCRYRFSTNPAKRFSKEASPRKVQGLALIALCVDCVWPQAGTQQLSDAGGDYSKLK